MNDRFLEPIAGCTTVRVGTDPLVGRRIVKKIQEAGREVLEAFVAQGRPVELLIVSGGSAGNARWCQTHADALGIPVAVPVERDGVLLGSAMLGGAAAGTFGSLPAAMQAMTRLGRVMQPEPRQREFHDRKYRVYRRMIDDQLAYRALMSGA